MTQLRPTGRNVVKGLLLLLIIAGSPACAKDNTPARKDTAKVNEKRSGSTVNVYYFHTTFRCATCNMFEEMTRDVVEKDFADNIKAGKLTFESVNIEEEGNKHYVQDYKLYTKSVVISIYKDGQEASWKNLDKIWELARNRDELREYIKTNIAEMLKG